MWRTLLVHSGRDQLVQVDARGEVLTTGAKSYHRAPLSMLLKSWKKNLSISAM